MQILDNTGFDWANSDTWEQRQALIAMRKRDLENQMRQEIQQQAFARNQPIGQMVSRHFVPTATTGILAADLAPLISKITQNVKANQIANGEGQLSDEQARAGDDVLRRLAPEPTLRPMTGPMPDGSAMPDAMQSTPAPTGNARTVILAQGLKVPALADMSRRALLDQLIDQPKREDDQAFKSQELQARLAEVAATRDATTAYRTAENQRQVARDAQTASDRAADRSSREATAAEQRALRRDLIAAQIEGRSAAAANKPAKPLPNAVHKELSTLEDAVGNITGLADSFKPEYAGPGQGVMNTIDSFNPFSNGSEANNWWKNYAKRSSLEEAHRLFGAAFTDAEQARWNAADISPNMSAATIQRNLATRAAIAKRMFANGVSRYERGGYPQVRDAFNPDSPRETVGSSTLPGAPKVGEVRSGYRFKGGNPNDASNWVAQ